MLRLKRSCLLAVLSLALLSGCSKPIVKVCPEIPLELLEVPPPAPSLETYR